MRVPLKERHANWTEFEGDLFTLITFAHRKGEPQAKRFLFSARLEITQRMLDAYDKACEDLNRSGVPLIEE